LEHTEEVTEGKECKRAAVPEGENLSKERRWELDAQEFKAEQRFAAFLKRATAQTISGVYAPSSDEQTSKTFPICAA
jgi:hypothetical protein